MKKIINDQVLYDSEKRVLSAKGERTVLSAPTARLLELFLENNYRQLNRELIIEEVWGRHGMIPSGHSLNKSVSMLRKAFSGLGMVDLIVTIPREGFIFQAQINNVSDEVLNCSMATLSAVNKSAKFACYRKLVLWFLFSIVILFFVGRLLAVMLRDNDSVVHVLKSGSCDIYTTDDNSKEKISHFLNSPKWQSFSSICKGRYKVIVFYDDNSLSAGNKLREYFFSVCKMERKGIASECENYIY
ncbi:TPA: transcriptional regulator [Enterobacter asburiae]